MSVSRLFRAGGTRERPAPAGRRRGLRATAGQPQETPGNWTDGPRVNFGGIVIGTPRQVWGSLSIRAGRLNLSSVNLRLGLTADPYGMLELACLSQPWRVMHLVWATRCPEQAAEMEGLLRSWDGKLFLPDPGLGSALARGGSPVYAFLLTR